MVVCKCRCCSPILPPTSLPDLCPHAHPLHLHLQSCLWALLLQASLAEVWLFRLVSLMCIHDVRMAGIEPLSIRPLTLQEASVGLSTWWWKNSQGTARAGRCVSTFQASAYVMVVDDPSVKTSYLAMPKFKEWRYRPASWRERSEFTLKRVWVWGMAVYRRQPQLFLLLPTPWLNHPMHQLFQAVK